MKVACGCLTRASFRSMRFTVLSAPGEPKPAEAVGPLSGSGNVPSCPTGANFGSASKLDITTVYAPPAVVGSQRKVSGIEKALRQSRLTHKAATDE